MRARVLIIQPGDKLASLGEVPGDFGDWVRAGMGLGPGDASIIRVDQGERLPGLDGIWAVVVTGSSAMVTERAAWMIETAGWLRQALQRAIPILGICFGHQLLAYALGGQVAYNPRGIEVGTRDVDILPTAAADPLLGGLPPRVRLHLSHRQSVTELPPGAAHLACSRSEPHQAFVIDSRAWGVQFHPEFSAPVMRGYIDHYRSMLRDQGVDADVLASRVSDKGPGPLILRRFAALAGLAPSPRP